MPLPKNGKYFLFKGRHSFSHLNCRAYNTVRHVWVSNPFQVNKIVHICKIKLKMAFLICKTIFRMVCIQHQAELVAKTATIQHKTKSFLFSHKPDQFEIRHLLHYQWFIATPTFTKIHDLQKSLQSSVLCKQRVKFCLKFASHSTCLED